MDHVLTKRPVLSRLSGPEPLLELAGPPFPQRLHGPAIEFDRLRRRGGPIIEMFRGQVGAVGVRWLARLAAAYSLCDQSDGAMPTR